MARRGFVVLSPDLQGGGESDPDVDRGIQAITTAQYANGLSFVQYTTSHQETVVINIKNVIVK